MYEKYGLESNPFEIAPVDYSMAGRNREWSTIKSRLDVAFKGTTCKFIVLLGDYGLGKTFTVDKLYFSIMEQKDELKTVVVRTLTGEPIQAQPAEPSKAKFALDFITRVFKNLKFEQLHEIGKRAKLDKKIPEISLRTRTLFFEIGKGNRSAFLALLGESTNELGERLDFKPIRTSEEAKEVFFNFLHILKLAGYENLLVILDEFEYIMTLSPARITVILQTLREIFDEYSRAPSRLAKVVILFTVSPGGWNRLSDLEANQVKKTGGAGIVPFKQRIDPRDFISLSPLSSEETEQLIRIRLEKHRSPDAQVSNPLYPFTKPALGLIHQASQGVPRIILVYAGILLDYASEHNLGEIKKEDVIKALSDLNLYAEKTAVKSK